jgi:hypothetical protein
VVAGEFSAGVPQEMTSTRDDTAISSHEESAIDRYQHLIEHVQDAVVEFELVDGEPVVREINQSFVDVFGC